jgi:2-oxoglutarate ferredoxin oxidoreductase subunit beta
VNVISPCITFYNTYKIVPTKLAEIPADHDPSNRAKAFELALQRDHVLLGTFYREQRPTFEENVAHVITKAQAAGAPRLEQIFAEFS